MEEPLSQQSIIESATLQLELLKLTDEVLKTSVQEKQATVAKLFEQYDRDYQQGLITQETQEQLVNLWLDLYLAPNSSASTGDNQ